jgi:UDP-N-acetylglucosamine--N-acetylmuramyl-(pentapeptide) pyrophosphoryl-undecaprenol N-acetylglucosamine transferase
MGRTYFFAGGGTGGHIYPALAVAERIKELEPSASIVFLVSERSVDEAILSKTDFKFIKLNACGFSLRPSGFAAFLRRFRESYHAAAGHLKKAEKPLVIGVGGFVSSPVCVAAWRAKIGVKLINVDFFAGKANKLNKFFAEQIFVQFDETRDDFKNKNVQVVGCPLRREFDSLNGEKAFTTLNLDENKKTLLITGASTGAKSVNDSVCSLLGKLDSFADLWQIVHVTGRNNYSDVLGRYKKARIKSVVVDYCDFMPELLGAADLVIGRSGAVSVAEYAAAGLPAICMPYPHHRDRHQYFNAEKLVEAGAAIVVDDLPDENERTEWLWEELSELLNNEQMLKEMRDNAGKIGKKDAALRIAEMIISG